MMIKKRCASLEAPYAIIVAIFLFALNRLNHTLLSLSVQNEAISPFELLSYHNYEPLYFFLMAVVLTIAGVALSIYHIRQIKHMELEYDELLATLLSIFINIFLIILLFVFINNPILRAIICVVFIVNRSYIHNDAKPEKRKRSYIQARNFFFAAIRCGRAEICEESGMNQVLSVPEYVNIAFSCELYIKTLLYQDNEPIQEHNLINLFDQLNEKLQKNCRIT